MAIRQEVYGFWRPVRIACDNSVQVADSLPPRRLPAFWRSNARLGPSPFAIRTRAEHALGDH